jgi:hypothetical protein
MMHVLVGFGCGVGAGDSVGGGECEDGVGAGVDELLGRCETMTVTVTCGRFAGPIDCVLLAGLVTNGSGIGEGTTPPPRAVVALQFRGAKIVLMYVLNLAVLASRCCLAAGVSLTGGGNDSTKAQSCCDCSRV